MNNNKLILGIIGAGVVGYLLGTGYYNQFIKPQPKPLNPQPKPIIDTMPVTLANPKGLIEGGVISVTSMCATSQA